MRISDWSSDVCSSDLLDCRYCHTGVETSAHARLPTIAICMSCHSQLYRAAPVLAPLHKAWIDHAAPLAWQRVHDLPDFVSFDHSIPINKGVGCSLCHGDRKRTLLNFSHI